MAVTLSLSEEMKITAERIKPNNIVQPASKEAHRKYGFTKLLITLILYLFL